jgi:hypothetical protein
LGDYTLRPLLATEIEQMDAELAAGRWVVASVLSSEVSHCIVVKSYDDVTDTYEYWDPWTDEEDSFTGYDITHDEIRLPWDEENSDCRLVWLHFCN